VIVRVKLDARGYPGDVALDAVVNLDLQGVADMGVKEESAAPESTRASNLRLWAPCP
jgi:hypothetical protein